MRDGEAFAFERALPMPMRFFLAAAGLFCIVMTAVDLGRVTLQLGWWTPFVWAIVGGAWVVGGIFLAGAIVGESQHWTFSDGSLILSRRTLLGRTTQVIRETDVEGTDIREVTWDSRADSFSVVLRLKSGTEFWTPDYDTRAAAEATEARMRGALRLPS
jgi:uncharacterized membrane protein YdbT with pleckstrin-like domain